MNRNEMGGEWRENIKFKRIHSLEERLDEIKDLLLKVIERQEKIELSGNIEYGEPHHIGRKEKQVNISLRKSCQLEQDS